MLFIKEGHPDPVVVTYNPAAITSAEVLTEIRKLDSQAVMASFQVFHLILLNLIDTSQI